MAEHLWLLQKRGLYYRPNGQGYTGIKDHAGRYTEADACSHMRDGNGVGRIREDAASEFSEACFEDLARDHLKGQRDEARAEIVRLRKALSAAKGYLMNAAIDLQTGARKRTALATIEGGLRMVEEALVLPDPPPSAQKQTEG